jgi:hypothetical protein
VQPADDPVTVQRLPVRKRAAKKPAVRTVDVGIAEGDFEGWQATFKVDFPASYLEDLESKNAVKFLAVMDKLIVDHNFPDVEGEVAATMRDVDPYTGLVRVSEAYLDALRALPPR